jgi:UDP-3-O-[3-hydroxymyristoyl] glucosamine N-acyltransferase
MFRLHELVDRLGGEIVGDGASRCARRHAGSGGEGDLAFLANRKYLSQVGDCAAQCAHRHARPARGAAGRNLILTADPYLYFARVAQAVQSAPAVRPGVHPLAAVACALPASVQVGPGASIEEDVSCSARTW